MTKAATPCCPVDAKDGSEKDYEANNACDTITRAAEYQMDEKLMARVRKVLGRKAEAIAEAKAVVGLKKLRGSM